MQSSRRDIHTCARRGDISGIVRLLTGGFSHASDTKGDQPVIMIDSAEHFSHGGVRLPYGGVRLLIPLSSLCGVI